MYFVYVIKSTITGRYYIGSTQGVPLRLSQHDSGMMRSTRGGRPWTLVHYEPYDSRSAARRRENQIKAWKNPAYMEAALRIR